MLAPADVDPATGYRRYRRDQVDDGAGDRGAPGPRAAAARRSARSSTPTTPADRGVDPARRARPARGPDRAAPARAPPPQRPRATQPGPRSSHEGDPPCRRRPRPPELDPERHRALGVGLFNRTWDAARDRGPDARPGRRADPRRPRLALPLGRGRRRRPTCPRRVACAPGSTRSSAARSRRSGTPAGASSIVEGGGEGIEDWDLPAAYEAMARALAVAGDLAAAAEWKAEGARGPRRRSPTPEDRDASSRGPRDAAATGSAPP